MLPTSTLTALHGAVFGLGADSDYAVSQDGEWSISATARAIATGEGRVWDALSLSDKEFFVQRARVALTDLPDYQGTTVDDPSAGQQSYSEGFKTYYGTEWSPSDLLKPLTDSLGAAGTVVRYLPWAIGGIALYKIAKIMKVI